MTIQMTLREESSEPIDFNRKRKQYVRGIEDVRDQHADPLYANIGEGSPLPDMLNESEQDMLLNTIPRRQEESGGRVLSISEELGSEEGVVDLNEITDDEFFRRTFPAADGSRTAAAM